MLIQAYISRLRTRARIENVFQKTQIILLLVSTQVAFPVLWYLLGCPPSQYQWQRKDFFLGFPNPGGDDGILGRGTTQHVTSGWPLREGSDAISTTQVPGATVG